MAFEFAFVVTKPLQLIFTVAIIRQLNVADRSCIIITDSFSGSEGVAERLRSVDWDLSRVGVLFCRDRSKAEQIVADMGAKKIFVDGDVGVRRFLILLKTQICINRPEIWVYEEGHGTYRTDLYSNSKRAIFASLGVGTHFGGSSLAKGLYVLAPDEYDKAFPHHKKEVHQIESAPYDTIKRDFTAWCEIFSYVPITNTGQKTCALYLSSWVIDPIAIERLKKMPGDIFIKPHPHIRNFEPVPGIMSIDPGAPSELVLIALLKEYDHVEVFDHMSSVRRYIHDSRLIYQELEKLND